MQTNVEALVAERTHYLDSLNKQLEDLQENIQKQAGDVFAKASKEIFEGCPELGEFGWVQYTPYFNDGDPCVFSANDVYIHSKGDEDLEDGYWESSNIFSSYGVDKVNKILYEDSKGGLSPYNWGKDKKEVPNPNYDPYIGGAVAAIKKLRGSLNDATLEALFGDHCVVRVTASGVEVEEYDHD